MATTIYHNPNCGTSRNALAMIEASGESPKVIYYLDTPPSREKLLELRAMMQISPGNCYGAKAPPKLRHLYVDTSPLRSRHTNT